MARKHVQKHLDKLKKKHDRVRARLFKLFQKVARHKGSWKPMGGRRKKKGGYQIGGSGLTIGGSGFTKRRGRKGAVRKRVWKKRKLPKWVTRKTVPKQFPKKHAEMTKHAKGFSDFMSKAGTALGNTFNKHKDTITKIGSALGSAALNMGTQFVSGKIQQAQALANQKLQQANAQFNSHLQTAQARAQNAMAQAQSTAQGYMQQGQAMGQQYMQQGQQMAQGYAQQGQQYMQQQGQQHYDAAGNMLGFY